VLVNLSHDRYRRAVRRVRETVLSAGVLIVPSVIGLSTDAAVKALLAAGFRGYGEESAGKGPTGLVLSEDPPAGSVVPESARVILDVSGDLPRPPHAVAPSGLVIASMPAGPSLPPQTTAPMPSVVGLQLALAANVLTKVNIVYAVTYQSGLKPKGIVLSQTRVAGAIVRVQSKVELTVTLGPASTSTGTPGQHRWQSRLTPCRSSSFLATA
jgi:beta-lactam-binding protein with PASTA domain